MTIRTRIIIAVVFLVSLILVGFGTLLYYDVVDTQLARLDARLESHGEKVSAELEENSREPTFPDIPSLLELRTEGLPQPAMKLLDSSENIIYADSIVRNLPSHEWSEITTTRGIWETIECSGRPNRAYWMPVEIDDHFRYALQIVVSLDELTANASRLRLQIAIAIPLLLLVAAFSIYGIIQSAFKPITAMIETAEHTSASDLSKRIILGTTQDEVHALGSALNIMMTRIESAFGAQKQFIADASHEIRTPLTIIQSELEFAGQRMHDATSRKSLRIALAEVEHLRKLSNDLLLIAKLDSSQAKLNLERVDLTHIVLDCVRRMKPMARKRSVSLVLAESPQIYHVVDNEKIRSVVLNLLDNAIKYSGPKSTVRIVIGRKDRFSTIVVEDNGSGILADELPHIFDRFHQGPSARAEHNGNGLGLSIAEKIIELHGGTINVQSRKGQGSTFTISLPL
ncbi:MAG TPA: HAMP domain-containing sensor histidine kinase [Bacteroidota bacterium]